MAAKKDSGLFGKVYAYTDDESAARIWQDGEGEGLLKVGYTSKDDAEERIKEQEGTSWRTFDIRYVADAFGRDGNFTDKDVHKILERMGCLRITKKGKRSIEWFECTTEQVEAAVKSLQTGEPWKPERLEDFGMRPEQEQAVKQTEEYFQKHSKEKSGVAPRYLWNAKMRFGKTFAALQLAKRLGYDRIIIPTFKPAVQDAWQSDLENHVDFADFQFAGKDTNWEDLDPKRPIVFFVSFQDLMGKGIDGKIKERLRPFMKAEWGLAILDEYHFGSWREGARELYDSDRDKEGLEALELEEAFSEEAISETLSVDAFLYLSGTPFRSLGSGEFTEDQIFSWTYSDEQRAKDNWNSSQGDNPYAELPQMVLHTYEMPEAIRRIAEHTDRNEFDINEFFKAEELKDDDGKKSYQFKHEQDVQNFLDLLIGEWLPSKAGDTGTAFDKSHMPFTAGKGAGNLLGELLHTLWFMPDVKSCYAMAELMAKPQNPFYHKYNITIAAGPKAGIGLNAIPPIREGITRDPLNNQSITLSCGKATTGVTISEWSGVLMLRNTTSPETYFQTAFRAQSPWTKKIVDTKKGKSKEIIKHRCHIIDFAPNRALGLIQSYAAQLDTDPRKSAEEKVEEFMNYLPIISAKGGTLEQLDARSLMDEVAAGTTSTALARKWQSRNLIDVSKEALEKLLSDEELIHKLEEIESFRNLRDVSETMINLQESIQKLKTKKATKELNKKEKKQLSEAEKELNKRRKELQENLLKFTARIPVFMYLTEKREKTLIDVIENIEPTLFKKVTGITVEDFKELKDLGVFRASEMNEAVYQFRRFEDPSLHYADRGLTEEEKKQTIIGGFDSRATLDDIETGRV